MKIIKVEKFEHFLVKIDSNRNFRRNYNNANWEVLIGGRWESYGITSEIEALFQQWLSENKPNVVNIFAEIQRLQLEVTTIQENCKHEKYFIGNYSWRVGTVERSRICTECFKNIGHASKEENEQHEYDENRGLIINKNGARIYKNEEIKTEGPEK